MRVADIYFTEFNRLFFHYYFRSVHEEISQREAAGTLGVEATSASDKASYFLDETPGWTKKYAAGTLKTKRVKMFNAMAGAKTLPLG